MKRKYCEDLGIEFNQHSVISKESLVDKINELNSNDKVKGYFIQLPLPQLTDVSSQNLLDLIDPKKDIDCLTSLNLGKVLSGSQQYLPGTVRGIINILDTLNVSYKSKNIVIVNNSILIGKPIAMYLSNKGSTVTICNEFTLELKSLTINADILITATGVKHLITESMVKKDSIIIDAGICIENGQLFGDVDFKHVLKKVQYITPVPGGVGPLTITFLVQNLIDTYK